MKKIALAALSTVAFFSGSAHAQGYNNWWWWDPPPHTVSAPEMSAGFATFAAALIGFVGYMLLRRRHAESK